MRVVPPGSPTPWQVALSLAGGGALLAAYLVACHVATARHWPWAIWLYAAPTLGMLVPWVATRVGGWSGRVLALGVFGVIAYALHRWQASEQGVLFVAQHAGTNLALCGVFGLTLLGDREPLITRFARILRRDDMPPPVLAYTRKATLAWTVFFAVVATVSVLLYLLAPLTVWSAFANLISAPLVGLMFVGEYAVRRYTLRGIRHHALLDAVAAARQPWSNGGAEKEPGIR